MLLFYLLLLLLFFFFKKKTAILQLLSCNVLINGRLHGMLSPCFWRFLEHHWGDLTSLRGRRRRGGKGKKPEREAREREGRDACKDAIVFFISTLIKYAKPT